MMIIENIGVSKEELIPSYWLKSNEGGFYAVTLKNTISKRYGLTSVKAIAYKANVEAIDDNIDYDEINNGDLVYAFSLLDDWVLEIDIHGKYYFPTFNNKNNQWYHKESDIDNDEIEDFNFILKETYNLAMKISGLQTY